MSRKKKKIALTTVLLVAATAGGILWWRTGAKAAVEAPRQTVEVVRKDLELKVSSTGVVEPEFTVEIKSKASGEVARVLVQEGTSVKKGQLLLEIDPVTERRKVTQARAELRIAESQRSSVIHKHRFAISQLERDAGLLKKGLVSAESVLTLRREVAVLKSEVSVAAAQVLRARESLREVRDRLAETKIKSPINGIVLERSVQPGQIAASGTNSVSGGTTLLKIADLRRLFVRVKVDEADIAQVKTGQPVTVTADALRGKKFGGKVLRVAPQGKIENNVTVFEVVVEVDASGREALRPMMSTNVEIQVAKRAGALTLPTRAIRRGSKGDRQFVVLAAGGIAKVKLGLSDGKDVEITGGVEAQTSVVLPSSSGGKKKGARGGNDAARRQRMMQRGMGGRR